MQDGHSDFRLRDHHQVPLLLCRNAIPVQIASVGRLYGFWNAGQGTKTDHDKNLEEQGYKLQTPSSAVGIYFGSVSYLRSARSARSAAAKMTCLA